MFRVSDCDRKLYPLESQRDPVIAFIEKVSGRISSAMHVLDIGAGSGARNAYALRGKCQELVGVDLDPRVLDNPLLDRGVVADAGKMPFDDNSFDLLFAIYVLEHIEDPKLFCREVSRVLKPGGEFWALMPNKIHYVPLIARMTPTAFHRWANEKRGRNREDTFPTYYRLNSKSKLRHHFGEVGMHAIDIKLIEVRPNYLTFSLPTFLAGVAYERLVNRLVFLEQFRVNIISGFILGK